MPTPKMRLLSPALVACWWCSAAPASADLSLEHTATLRLSKMKQPLIQLKMYNSWNPQRHRLMLKYAVQGMPAGMPEIPQMPVLNAFTGMPAGPGMGSVFLRMPELIAAMKGSGIQPSGEIALVQRADDNRLIAYESQSRYYVSEPRRELLTRLRFDPWKKLAPRLSETPPPTFTDEQRDRMLEELKAITSPIQRRTQKLYYRPLTHTRTFKGMAGRGYRLTQLDNIGLPRAAAWVRTAFEWWLADPAAGDEVVGEFNQASGENLKGILWPTTSMFINEYLKLATHPRPDEWGQASRTFMPANRQDPASLAPTPLYMGITISPPSNQKEEFGDIRLEIAMTNRSTSELAPTVFESPSGYKQHKLDPFLKQIEPFMTGAAWEKLWDSVLGKLPAN